MNKAHWSGWTEVELARMRAGGTVRASRPARGAPGCGHVAAIPDVTADARAVLAVTEPAYPPEWLPELRARGDSTRSGLTGVRATTPVEWMRENAPDPVVHRNGTAPVGSPPSEAYPVEWLSQADLHPRGSGLGGEGWLNRKAA